LPLGPGDSPGLRGRFMRRGEPEWSKEGGIKCYISKYDFSISPLRFGFENVLRAASTQASGSQRYGCLFVKMLIQ
jgi:hypothetical protein